MKEIERACVDSRLNEHITAHHLQVLIVAPLDNA